tara:strand:+ start:42856 stop:43854 length:999 start_codon:yes stop_codon:yes gene_type:complete
MMHKITHDLNHDEMTDLMTAMMSGDMSDDDIIAALNALKEKGETITEITAAAQVMRSFATGVKVNKPSLVDIVGTGGDGLNTFNISTATAIVVAASGGIVAKHGNRSFSSKSGSADVLDAAGVNLDLNAEQIAQLIEQINIGFIFAPKHHGAMKHVMKARKQMGTRTIFNLLGPLTNPSGATHHLIGVYDKALCQPFAEVLKQLGSQHALIVHSEDGMDEISIAAPTFVCELNDGDITEYTITPEQFGLERQSLDSLVIDDAQQSLAIIHQVFDDQPGAARDIVILNSGAALYAANITNNLEQGIALAKQTIEQRKAQEKLAELISLSQQLI